MSEDIYRLQKLLEHWVEHNEDHTARFINAANEADKLGLKDVASDIQKAAENAQEVTKYLKKALDSLK